MYAWPDPLLAQSSARTSVTDHTIRTLRSSPPVCWLGFGLSVVLGGLLGLSTFRAQHGVFQMSQAPYHSPAPNLGQQFNTFRTANEYSDRHTANPGPTYPWLKNHQLVEPFRETILTLSNTAVSDHTYTWEIFSPQGTPVTALMGHHIIHTFLEVGKHVITITELDGSQNAVAAWQDIVFCKYVRREIRALLEEDRKELLDAMLVLWTVSRAEGELLYGPGYVDLFSIAMLHTAAANDVLCDRAHDGLGFLVSHNFFTNILERSLQLVNPKLAMPYWDYTIEAHKVAQEQGGDYRRLEQVTPMFTSDYFGSSSKDTLMVQDGRWANYSVPRVPDRFKKSVRPNVYGLMRSPWNNNHRPYLTRGLGNTCGYEDDGGGGTAKRLLWPNCKEHYSLQMNYSSFYSWAWYGMYRPHGPVHLWIGGFNDCAPMFKRIKDLLGERDAAALESFGFLLNRSMMRGRWWGCREEAPAGTTREELHSEGYCGCTFDLDDHSQLDAFFEDISMGTMAALMRWQDLPTKRQVADILCAGDITLGDHAQGSSILDPSFWPIHPTMERLWMYKRLTGTLEDLWWPNGTVIREVDGVQQEYIISWENEECIGHGPDDVFPYGLPRTFDVHVNLFGEVGVNKYTNAEVLAMLDPRVDALNYVYDNFEWPHCQEEGFDMNDVWDIDPHAALTQGERALFKTRPSPLLLVKK